MENNTTTCPLMGARVEHCKAPKNNNNTKKKQKHVI